MSIITDEMDRLKGISIDKFRMMNQRSKITNDEAVIFELGYAYGMDDARKIQEKIKILAEVATERVEKLYD